MISHTNTFEAEWPIGHIQKRIITEPAIGTTSVPHRHHYYSGEIGTLYLPGLSTVAAIFPSFAPLRLCAFAPLRETRKFGSRGNYIGGFSQRRKGAKRIQKLRWFLS